MSRNKSNPLAERIRTSNWVKKRGYTKCQKHKEECINTKRDMVINKRDATSTTFLQQITCG